LYATTRECHYSLEQIHFQSYAPTQWGSIAPDGVFHRSTLVGYGPDVWLVKQFGGGFLSQLNGPDEQTVPEYNGGFTNVAPNPARRYHENFGAVERGTSLVLHSSVDAGIDSYA